MTTPAVPPADAARLDAVRDEWIAIGNSTEPADRDRAERGVAAAYTAAGLQPPKYVFWVGSPYAAIMATAVLPEALAAGDASGAVKVSGANHLAKLRERISRTPATDTAAAFQTNLARLLDPVENAITGVLNETTRPRGNNSQTSPEEFRATVEAVRADLSRQLSAYAEAGPFNANTTVVADQVTGRNTTIGEGEVPRNVDNYVMENVTNAVLAANEREEEHRRVEADMNAATQRLARSDAALKHKVERWRRGRIWAQYNAGYYAYIAGLGALGFDIAPIQGQLDIAASVGWWWAFHDFTVFSERPVAVRFDPQNRLHCADGPAIEYPDGWGIYMWQGHRIPRWVTEDFPLERIGAETNAEVRRCAIEAYGWDRYIRDAQLELIDSCDDPGNPGHRLELYNVPERVWGSRVRVLLAINGSPRADGEYPRFGLPVPAERNISTALAAAAWGYGLEPELYAQMQRRA